MTPPGTRGNLGISERTLLWLVSAVQFVNVLDFMIVMPLGPDFARDLHIPLSQLGIVGGSYTFSAAIAGVLGSKYLDRFDRRSALGVSMIGLVLGTIAAGFAWDLSSLLAARLVAGLFGGPATSVALSVIADAVPSKRRGRALGIVMGAMAGASVFGVPLSLELARAAGWRAPFLAVGGIGLVVAVVAVVMLPQLRLHMHGQAQRARIFVFLRDPAVMCSLAAMFSVMVASFGIVPNLSAYLQRNRGYPREHLGALYLCGGAVSYVAMRVVGGYVDRLGAARVASVGTLLFIGILGATFVYEVAALPAMLIFVVFTGGMALRNVSLNTLSSRVALPHERGRFLSLQSAVQHLAAAFGAVLASQLLTELPDGRLAGMSIVAQCSIVLALAQPLLLYLVERELRMNHRPSLPQAWSPQAEVARHSIPPA